MCTPWPNRNRSTSPSCRRTRDAHPRVYSNFCAIAHTPFDMTLTFCEVLPLTEKDLKQAEAEHVVPAPVRVERRRAAADGAEPHRRAAGAHAGRSRSRTRRRCSAGALAPSTDMKTRAPRLGRILGSLTSSTRTPTPNCNFSNAFELLVATILSAQTTDVGVNGVTPCAVRALPGRAGARRPPTPPTWRRSSSPPASSGRRRALIIGMSQALVDGHGGEVPRRHGGAGAAARRGPQDRERRPGARARRARTAGRPARAPRVQPDRPGARRTTRKSSSSNWARCYPPKQWRLVSDTLILHGRRICNPKPLCDRCAVHGDVRRVPARCGAAGGRGRSGAPSAARRSRFEDGRPPTAAGQRPDAASATRRKRR